MPGERGRNLLALSSPLAAVVLLDMIYVDKSELLLKYMVVVMPFPITYDEYCRRGNLIEAIKLWDVMLDRDLKPDILAYSFFIYGCCVTGEPTKAFELRDDMMSRGLKPNRVTYNTLIRGTCLTS
ncbi:hypothetical protein ACFX2I_029432 [Malus domestica]